ncbi:hypothetical protein [Streptomyces sp. Wb2n-11]|uniref:hypothetical protein n=1 Tax=Streptomyces sp. Wb2n-11 TaxID=1030533 RepID=UPI000AA8699F
MKAADVRAGLTRTDTVAPYSATVGIGEVRDFGQSDAPGVPGFTGPLHSRPAAYGAPGSVRPRNPYDAQRALAPGR